jgi:hypothetical protein
MHWLGQASGYFEKFRSISCVTGLLVWQLLMQQDLDRQVCCTSCAVSRVLFGSLAACIISSLHKYLAGHDSHWQFTYCGNGPYCRCPGYSGARAQMRKLFT